MTPINFDRIIGIATLYIPEIILTIAAIVMIFFSLFKFSKSWSFYVAIIGIIVQLSLVATHIFPVIMSVAAVITILISGRHHRMEYYLFILFLLTGAFILTKSVSFITIILSFEVISVSSYILTAGLDPEKGRAEAAWKFFIYGSIATAIMIFGMTYWYGVTGIPAFERGEEGSHLLTIGVLMMLAGFLFKTTAAPFHLWAPDVYQATPAPIVAYFSVVPKLAALGAIINLAQSIDVSDVIAAAAILSMIIGTLAALSQTDAKRMMAYSSVAQAGIMLAAISVNAIDALIFYAIVFATMNFAVFITIGTKDKTAFTDFSGMGYTNPITAITGTLALVSLVGLPPVAGFMGKLFVFTGVWKAYSAGGNPVFLALFVTGLVATAASLFFYLKIPFYMFFRRPGENPELKISLPTNLLLFILVAILLTLFIAPGIADGLSY